MNWGNKLILVFIAFGTFIGVMVYKCMQSPISLVSKEYYKDELNYQQVIDADKSARLLSAEVALVQNDNSIRLQLPKEMNDRSPEGSVWFYCVNDGSKDRKFRLETGNQSSQDFALDALSKGRYVVKIEWNAQGTDYYAQKDLVIP